MLIEKIATKHSFICPFLPENVQLFAYQPSNCKPYSYYIMLVWMYLCVLRVNMFGLAFESCVCLCVMATINGFHTIAQYHPTNSIQFKPIFIRIILFNMFVNNVLLVLWLFLPVFVLIQEQPRRRQNKGVNHSTNIVIWSINRNMLARILTKQSGGSIKMPIFMLNKTFTTHTHTYKNT